MLLAAAWRAWPADELRAVLAHEIAHAARGDFVARLVAAVAGVLHAYHPLVGRLRRRLHLHQELAADARAAAVCGGAKGYARALAAVALRADAIAAPAFFSDGRTLLRRIAMLRVTDDSTSRPARRLAAVAVLAVAAAAVGLRGTPHDLAASPPDATKPAKDRPPLDASYIVPAKGTCGVCAVRVGELVAGPDGAALKELLDSLVETAVKSYDWPAGLKVEDIEQIAGRVTITVRDKAPPNHTLGMSLTACRTTRDFDCVKTLRDKLGDAAKVVEYGGATYLKLPEGKPVGFGPCCYQPDARTFVADSEEAVKALIDRKGKKPAEPPYAAGWQEAAGGVAALVLHDADGTLAKALAAAKPTDAADKPILAAAATLFGKSKWLVAGLDDAGGCKVRLRAECAATDVKAVSGVMDLFAALGRQGATDLPEPSEKELADAVRLARDLARSLKVKADEAGVTLTASSKEELAKLLPLLAGAAGKPEPAKK